MTASQEDTQTAAGAAQTVTLTDEQQRVALAFREARHIVGGRGFASAPPVGYYDLYRVAQDILAGRVSGVEDVDDAPDEDTPAE